ncbi:discoidin domain-containing protein [Amedibacillus sp. YH-ame10]
MKHKTIKKIGTASLAATMTLSAIGSTTVNLSAKENISTQEADSKGYNVLGSVASMTKDGNQVTFNISTGERLRFTFLEENVFRMYMAPDGSDFQDYPTPSSKDHTATITAKTDSDYEAEYDVQPKVVDEGTHYTITTKKVTIRVQKENSLLKVMKADGTVVWEETEPLKYKNGSTVQTLKTDKDEYFYGGGTQNGRFSHKGNIVEVEKKGTWTDQGVASPNPFYWSTDGYGVVRNTWKPGTYDFAKTSADTITTDHNEKRFDAYYFIDDGAEDIFGDYYELTGNPAELPEYASYLGHLNCYNRDYWVEAKETDSGAVKLGDKWYKESTTDNGGEKETLLGESNATAQQVIEDHKSNDMPLGWFLPNDGYGCGYGQSSSQSGDLDNLKDFSDYAIENGVQTGLWTQSNLWPADPNNPQKGERDIYKEVESGVHSVKTDVAWVGPGYSMALNGISVAYDAIASKSGMKPNIVTLNGWAGTQRYGGIWTGDQTGGQWEYIRFHIPTYIGTSLSGQPNVGSDMDGIFGGKNKKVWTRDFQWKAFTTYMLDMDGWGSNQKSPWALGEDGTSINRTYLKLKAQLAPYTNTISHTATAEGGLPMIRAMFLEEENPYTLGKATEYQYMYGDNFLVAPVYQETAADAEGNDIRNNIYLPSTSDVWTDYFTGKQYRGGQILNNFDAPIWKLPLFVKNGAIIPMYPENNNPEEKTETNTDGLDRSQRIVEFYPSGKTEFVAHEDDGKTLGGATVSTNISSNVKEGTATLTIDKAIGSYTGMVKERSNEFIVNVSKAPTSVKGNVAGENVTFKEVKTQEEYDKATENVYFYNEKPSIIMKEYASKGSKYENTEETTAPKLYVKSAEKVDITEHGFKVVVEGFENVQDLGKDVLNESLAVPTGIKEVAKTDSEITVGWDAVEGATTYDIEVDGNIYRNILEASYTQKELTYLTDHTYRVRTVTPEGYSNWGELITVKTADNPYRNVPQGLEATFEDGEVPKAYSGKFENMFDEDNKSEYSSAAADAWKNKAMIIDLKKSYTLDKLEYICRENMANGAVTKFGVSYSNDGINWKEYGDLVNDVKQSVIVDNNEDGRQFMHEFSTKFNARYLKLTVKNSAAGMLQAYAIRPYIVEGSRGKLVGDVSNSGAIDEGDLTFYQNYMGLTPADSDWDNYIVPAGADIDENETIDAYDVSYVARQLGDPVTEAKKGVDGKIKLIPSKTDIKAGDVFTVDVYGIGLKNVNSFSVELPVDKDLFTTSAASASVASIFMKNLSQERIHTDMSIDNYISFTNLGKQELINGTGSLAKVSITAKTDFTWDTTETHAVLVGQDLTTVNATIDNTIEPIAPETVNILKASDLKSIAFDNDVKKDIKGTDLWQQSDWKEILFDGKTSGTLAEFKWFQSAATFPEEVKLPTDMTFTFNKVEPLTKVRVYNRADGNGSVTKIKAVGYKGDTKYDLGTFNAKQAIFEFKVPAEAKDGIDRVVITPQESLGSATGVTSGSEKNRMLSLYEIEFETDSKVDATKITLDKDNAKKVSINNLAQVSATVAPNNVSNPFYNITSSDENIAKVIKVPTETAYYYAIQGVSAGTVTLTATSQDGNFTDTMEFTVIAGADTTKLDAELATFDALYEILYTKESYNAVKTIANEARVLIEKPGVKQDEIDQVTAKLVKAIKTLKLKGSNTEQPSSADLINQSGMMKVDESSMSASEKQGAEYTIDGKSDTIWHSNYNNGYKLPQYVTIDLGAEYSLEQINMLARQESSNGHITHYRIEISNDEGTDKKFTPVVEGYFENDGNSLDEPGVEKEVKFDKVNARYVRFIALESLGGTKNAYASIAELNFFGKQVVRIDEALTKAKKVIDNDFYKYTISGMNAFVEVYNAALATSEKEGVTIEELVAAVANLKKATSDLANQKLATEGMVAGLASDVEKFKLLEEKYSPEEFKVMADAIANAEAILAKGAKDISGTEAGQARTAMAKAKLQLDELGPIDSLLQGLEITISLGNEVLADESINDVRPGKVKELQDAIAEGQKLVDANSTDRDAIKAATQAIVKATNELWLIVDKTPLASLIEEAEALDGIYTESSKAALVEAINSAKVVVTNDDATTMEVDAAFNTLSNAISNLIRVANKENLVTQIQIAQNIVTNIGNYIPGTVSGLEDLLAQAQAIVANETATQAEVDDMTTALTKANMRARAKADKSSLVEAINKAKAINFNDYTIATATALRNTLSNAEIVMNNDSVSQDAVDTAVEGIEAAIKALVKAPVGDTEKPEKPETPTTPEEPKQPEDNKGNDTAAGGNTNNGPTRTPVRTPANRNDANANNNADAKNDTEDKKDTADKKDTKAEKDSNANTTVKKNATPKAKGTTNDQSFLMAGLAALLVVIAGVFAFFRKKKAK